MATVMNLNLHNSRIRSALDVASQELATGQKSNLNEATAGDLSKLFAIDRTLAQLSSENDAINLALGRSGLTQLVLGHVQEGVENYGPQLLAAVDRGDELSMRILGSEAEKALSTMVSSLNTNYGRHTLFAGAAVDNLAFSPVETLLSDISTLVAGSVDGNAAIAAIDNYFFTAGGGFETNVYLGANQDAPPFRDRFGNEIRYAQRGDEIPIRQALRALVIAATASGIPGAQDQTDMLREAATSAMAATDLVIEMRGELGGFEENIANIQARNHAQSNFVELERSAILAADPYATATRFEALQGQLQSVYTLTARLSGLSLTYFLR